MTGKTVKVGSSHDIGTIRAHKFYAKPSTLYAGWWQIYDYRTDHVVPIPNKRLSTLSRAYYSFKLVEKLKRFGYDPSPAPGGDFGRSPEYYLASTVSQVADLKILSNGDGFYTDGLYDDTYIPDIKHPTSKEELKTDTDNLKDKTKESKTNNTEKNMQKNDNDTLGMVKRASKRGAKMGAADQAGNVILDMVFSFMPQLKKHPVMQTEEGKALAKAVTATMLYHAAGVVGTSVPPAVQELCELCTEINSAKLVSMKLEALRPFLERLTEIANAAVLGSTDDK